MLSDENNQSEGNASILPARHTDVSARTREERGGEGRRQRDGARDSDDGSSVSMLSEPPDGPASNRVLVSGLPGSRGLTDSSEPAPGSGPISAPISSALTYFDPLKIYLRDVQRHPLLTPDEENALAIEYATTGDVHTAATLVSSNLRLVVKIAYEYRRAYRNIMDLIQEGNIGLMQAVKRYDPYRGVKLSTYAAWWIRAYILRFVLHNERLVKLGTTQTQRRLYFNLNKEKARLTAMGIEPSHEELARQLDVDEQDIIDMERRLGSKEASLDAPVGSSDGRQVTRLETMASQIESPDHQLVEEQFFAVASSKIKAFRAALQNEKDIVIFDERMMSEEPLTLQEIGVRFGISRERVRQLETRLLARLRTYLQDELRDPIDMEPTEPK